MDSVESVEVVADASGSVLSSGDSALGVSSSGSYDGNSIVHSIVQNDSGNQSIGHTKIMVNPPLSPPRSAPSLPSTPGSPQRQLHSNTNTPQKSQSPMPQPLPQVGGRTLEFGGHANLLGLNQQITRTPERQYPQQRNNPGYSDDERTEPSSSVTGNTGENPAGYTRSDLAATSTFGRPVQPKKKQLKTGLSGSDSDEEGDMQGAIIYGYLQKLGRNGKWQTRWFETDGECLTYYKSSKRTKILATLDLAKVGSIVINSQDEKGCGFTINISERPYTLRADTKAACKDWVITLNRVKEARMQQGNVKLFLPDSHNPIDLLDKDYTPRVVVVANRHRTRAVDDEDIHSWEAGEYEDPANDSSNYVMPSSSNRLARWQKPGNTLKRMATKLMRWARSLQKHSCADAENHVVLDHHVHPPGHDYMPKRSTSSPKKGGSLDGDRPPVPTQNVDTDSMKHSAAGSASMDQDDEEGETRELS